MFLHNLVGGGFDSTQAGAGGVPGEKKPEGIVPMVIKQITENTEEAINFWNQPLHIATIVGIVRNIDHSATKITYRLEDHTGQIDSHQWIEENDSTIVTPQVLVNTYARAYGSVRNQGGGKTIMIFRLETVTTPNELTTHLLEVLNARFKAEEYSKKGDGGYTNEFSKGGSSMFMGNSNNQASSNSVHPQGISGEKLVIYEAIKHHISEQGITTAELKKKFAHMPASKIK